MPKAINLAENLRMDHLIGESADDIKAKIDAAMKSGEADAEQDPEDDPKAKEEYRFSFNWKDDRGKVWTGDFINKALTIAEQQAVAVMTASFGGAMPVGSMTDFMRTLNQAIAHMSYSLKKKAAWAKDLRKLHDPDLIFALYEEVASHEATFLGRNVAEKNSPQGHDEREDGAESVVESKV